MKLTAAHTVFVFVVQIKYLFKYLALVDVVCMLFIVVSRSGFLHLRHVVLVVLAGGVEEFAEHARLLRLRLASIVLL